MALSDGSRRSALRRGCMSGTAIGLLFALGIVPLPAMAQELPSGGSVTAGAATIATSGPSLTVTQTSQNAILSWQSFSVGGGASAHFENGTGATLNRVTGNLPSSIDGSLTATGSLYLINPAGVAVGTGGMVRTGGSFVASTHDASDADFLDGGDLTLKGSSKAEIVNRGFIASLGGDVVLTARRVENAGAIEAPDGSVGLLGGYEVLLRDAALADGRFAVKIGGADTEVVNTGTVRAAEVELRANGGNVQALAGNTKAIVKATGVKKAGGRIFLTAGEGGSVKATQGLVARHAASRPQRRQVAALPAIGPIPPARPDFSGGEVHVAGGSISLGGPIDASGSNGAGGAIVAVADHALTLTAGAALDASGSDGGLVLLGGDYQGGGRYWGAPLATTARTTVMDGATIRADGVAGAGGDIVVWADERTSFAGAISATGVSAGGDAEVSGKAVLDFTGSADLSAISGAFGTLLLDPYDVTISTGADTGGFTATGNDSVINATTLLTALNTANVTVSTGAEGTQAGDITVAADLAWTSDATLTLDAANDIALDAAITARAGGLTLDAGGMIGASGAVDIARFTLAAGSWIQNTPVLPAFAAGDFRIAGGSFLRATGGDGTAAAPWMLTDIYGVQGMGTHLAGNFTLAGDIDASGTQYWWDGAGFVPVGGSAVGSRFTGTFNGGGHVISGLTIDRPGQSFVGLFGDVWPTASGVATISDIGLDDVSVTGANYVGGLVGALYDGTISQAWVSGTVNGADYVGGLVGMNFGAVSQAWTDTAVKGTDRVGGLAGYNGAGSEISQAWASGTVFGADYVGGLVGYQGGGSKIIQAWATGAVTGGNNVGGLLGVQNSRIEQVWASGLVTGADSGTVGGLVGYQRQDDFLAVFWDKETTSQVYGIGPASPHFDEFPLGWGLTTERARSAAAYYNWDFTNDWYQAGDMRPVGRWMAASPDANGDIAVSNLIQLQLMGADLDASYVLTRDIDASATASTADSPGIWGAGGFVPIGHDTDSTALGFQGTAFTGMFDGQGHVISNLNINRGSESRVGLFGYVSGAPISNIGLDGVAITGYGSVGGLVGRQDGGEITQAWASGTVSGYANLGGLVGWQNDGTVAQAWANTAVAGSHAVGGLMGYQSNSTIDQAWANGPVNGIGSVGGLVGSQWSGTVTQSWASGPVTGVWTTTGGLVGEHDGGVNVTTGSFWDKDTTGQPVSAGGTGLTTVEARSQAPYLAAGWDFTTDWYQAGDMRPVGRWMAPPDTDGDGVREISTTMQLQLVDADRSGSYVLTRDLDAFVADGADTSGIWGPGGFVPIGQATGLGFTGSFDGQGHVISNLTIKRSYEGYVGLFGRTLDATIANIGIEDGSVTGYDNVGGLVGLHSGGSISRSYVTGTVSAVSNTAWAGGLVGSLSGGHICQSHATAVVSAGGFDTQAGGLVGHQDNGGIIEQAWASGSVIANGIYSHVGGLVGHQSGGGISQSYATTAITAAGDAANVGGLVGHQALGSIEQTWASGSVTANGLYVYDGGLAGYATGSISQSYWDRTTTGEWRGIGNRLPDAASATGLVTAQFQDTAGFMALAGAQGWDFRTVWAPPSAGYYPQLYALSHVVAVDASTSRLYGESNDSAALNYYGLRPGDFLVGRATLAGADATTGVGTHAVTAGGAATNTDPEAYRFVTMPGTLTITPRPLTVTGSLIERAYGDANPVITTAFTAPTGSPGSGSGLVNGDTIGSVTVDSTADATSAAGSYAFTPGGADFSAGDAGNYAITYVGGTLTVTPREITVSALGGTSVYGDGGVDPGLSATNLANGEDVSVLTGLYNSFGILPVSTAGTHALSVAGTLTNGNYTMTSTADGIWTVTPRAITVSADDLSRLYGDADPALTFGAIGGDGLASFHGDLAAAGFGLETTASAASDVGDYAVTLTGTNANYAMTFTPGTLTVTPRPITVGAHDIARLLGQADPALTWSITGGSLASFDTAGGVFAGTLARQAGELPGNYAITQGTLRANANYAMGFVPGTFTIAPVRITLGQPLERQDEDNRPLLIAGEDDGDTAGACAEGVLGPDCAAFIHPGNRDLGPYLDTAE